MISSLIRWVRAHYRWVISGFFLALGLYLLINLGIWQLHRAEEKKTILKTFADHTQQPPLNLANLTLTTNLQYYPVELSGKYDNAHTLLLDNQIFNSQVGYEVYTPFIIDGFEQVILVNRGWIRAAATRNTLPSIPPIQGTIRIKGILNSPTTYFTLGTLYEGKELNWPLRIEFIDLQMLTKLIGYPIFPYLLWLDSKAIGSLTPNWHIATISPEKHVAYAIQWFGLAIVLFLVFAAACWKRFRGQ